MGSDVIQIIVLAAIALFLVLRLRNLLGTRTGFEPPREQRPTMSDAPARDERPFEVIEGGGVDHDIADVVDPDSDTGTALAAMKRIEPDFSVQEFLHGARGAYEMILMAYESGDLPTLEQFLAPDVYDGFRQAVEARADQGLEVEARFVGIRELTLKGARFDEETGEADVTVRFTGELASVVRDRDGRVVEGDLSEIKQQRDTWTFSRAMGSDNPNWLLVATGD
ncbi:MAG: Tim44/TimA family putative adaptor protein [Pseudomonadota bacterium]